MPKRIPKYLRTHPLAVQTTVVIVVLICSGLLYAKQSAISNDIIESQVTACVRGNELRQTLIQNVKQQKVSTKATSHNLFPQIPKQEFEDLIQVAVKRLNDQIKGLQPINCIKAYPAAQDLDNIDELLAPND